MSSPSTHRGTSSMPKSYFVYILASRRNGTLYVGVTNNLKRRIHEHQRGSLEGFTKRYQIHILVYYECTTDIEVAIQREKQLKRWNRAWKIALIEKENPKWLNLSVLDPR